MKYLIGYVKLKHNLKKIQMDKIYLILIILMFQSSKINSQNIEFDSSINAFTSARSSFSKDLAILDKMVFIFS